MAEIAKNYPTRRNFLKAVSASSLSYAGAAAVGGFAGSFGEEVYNTLFNEIDVQDANIEALERLLGPINFAPDIFAGAGNFVRSIEESKKMSLQLDWSARYLTNFVAKSLGIQISTLENNNGERFRYSPNRPAFFLGSPAANTVVADIFGYAYKTITNEQGSYRFPYPKLDKPRLPWTIVFGETGYGEYSGVKQVANKYSRSTGLLVERPVFRIWDQFYNTYVTPRISNGFLANEWLSIVRMSDQENNKVLFSGMHGAGSEAFFLNLAENIEELSSITSGLGQFQVIVPVELTHESDLLGKKTTFGKIDWKSAKISSI